MVYSKWCFHDKLLVNHTPRYLYLVTTGTGSPRQVHLGKEQQAEEKRHKHEQGEGGATLLLPLLLLLPLI